MRTKCANCGMVYDLIITDMDLRLEREIVQQGKCPKCGSNANDPIPLKYEGSYKPSK
jgi:rRNA maturation protein Nop10